MAGTVFLTWNRLITFRCGASDSNFWSYRPKDLVFARAIRWACLNGYQKLRFRADFERKRGHFVASSVGRQSKSHFSTVRSGTCADRMPQLEHAVVAAVFRWSPAWLARAAGEVFYKYAA